MKNLVPFLLFLALASLTVAAFVADADVHMFPLFMLSITALAVWQFRPSADSSAEGRAAFAAIVAFGLFSVGLSYALTAIIPPNAAAWGVEAHPEDAGGVLYPIVNDGRENCLLGSVVFFFYFAFASFGRRRRRAAS